MSNKNYYVYKHTSPSGKVYIGITQQEPNKRWLNGLGYQKQDHFWNAIKKYGWDNFKHEILFSKLTKDDAEKIEKELIKKYNSYNRKYGYNKGLGGNSIGKHSEETKAKIGISHSGENHPLFGKKWGEHWNSIPVYCIELDRSFSCAVEAEYVLGISKTNIRECCKGSRRIAGGYHWIYLKDKNKENISESLTKKRGSNSKSVYCIELDREFEKMACAFS